MARKKRARERALSSRAPFEVARENASAHVSPTSYEDFKEDSLNIPLGSPTLPSGSNFRSDSEDDSKDEARKKLFNDLLNALHSPSHKKYGSFASCEAVKYSQGCILKSFHVEGAGELRVPLSAEDVSKLRGVCEKPQCWEIDASKVTFYGAPEFMSDTIQPLAMHAVRKLGRHGAAVPLAVQLHQIFLCDTDGDPFDCHNFTSCRDTGEEKGLFASLVLQIPTEDGYEGGGLVVRHRNSQKTFDCQLVSSIGFCYSVFFADCDQEWKKIKSGTRVCMTFKLFRQDSSVQALHRDFVACKVREAESALQPWLTDVMKGKCDIYSPKLAIPLSYRYGKDELFFDEVKGDDKIVLEVLKRCRDENGKQLLDLHLCLVPAFTCGGRLKHTSSSAHPDDDGYYLRLLSPSAHCGPHHGDGDENNDHVHDWTSDKNIRAPLSVSNQVLSKKDQIIFWTGEEDKLTMAFGHLGLDRREIVASESGCYSEEDEERDDRRGRPLRPYCKWWWYRALLVLWPRELSISVFCVFCETKL